MRHSRKDQKIKDSFYPKPAEVANREACEDQPWIYASKQLRQAESKQRRRLQRGGIRMKPREC